MDGRATSPSYGHMNTRRELTQAAKALAVVLAESQTRIVFAESCTGGLVGNALTGIAGISEYHCGSAVVYRVETKAEWLGVGRDILEKPGPVSKAVAEAMAVGVLNKTPEADVAVSVTGHLGPRAPRRQDGLIYVGCARRDSGDSPPVTGVKRHFLEQSPVETAAAGLALRNRRQIEAAVFVLAQAADWVT